MAAEKLNKFAGLVDGSVTVPELKDNMDEKDNTKALIVKQFKGYCRECGEYGHKKANLS